MSKPIGYFTVHRQTPHQYEDGLWFQIMHYAADGRAGQCSTVHERDLDANIRANVEVGRQEWPEDAAPPYIALRAA